MMESGFFSRLFDLSFSEFITTSVVKVLFILGMICGALYAVMLLLAGFSQGGMLALLGLVGAPIIFLVAVLLTRIWLELIIVAFRIAENTAMLVAQGEREAR